MNPCEEIRASSAPGWTGRSLSRQETQLHAHLAQCPHRRQSWPRGWRDLQTQMTSLWVEPPDSASGRSVPARPGRSLSGPARSPNQAALRATALCFRGWPAPRPPWCWLWAFASFSCQGEQMDSCQRQSVEVFQRPSRTPPLGSEGQAIPPPPTTQTARKTLRRIQSSRQNRTEETPRGRAPSPSDRPTAPNDTEDPQSPPNNNQNPQQPLQSLR